MVGRDRRKRREIESGRGRGEKKRALRVETDLLEIAGVENPLYQVF